MGKIANNFGLLKWIARIAIFLIAFSLPAQQSSAPAPTAAGNASSGDCLRRSIPLTLLTPSQDSPWHWQALQVLVGGKTVPIASCEAENHRATRKQVSGACLPASRRPMYGFLKQLSHVALDRRCGL
jgi:hypothetical protein